MSGADSNGFSKRRRRSSELSLVREATDFVYGPDMASTERTEPQESLQRTRRQTRIFRTSLSRTSSVCHAALNMSDLNLAEVSVLESTSPRDELFGSGSNGLLEVEMESLQIKAERCHRRTKRKLTCTQQLLDESEVANAAKRRVTRSRTCTQTSSSNSQSKTCSDGNMEAEGIVEEDLVNLYLNKNFTSPKKSGLETISELQEYCDEVECTKRKLLPKAVASKRKTKVKKQVRFIPHVAIADPVNWWAGIPLKRQAESRRKARQSGYRPSSEKRLEEAEKRVMLTIAQIDHDLENEEQQQLPVVMVRKSLAVGKHS